MRAVGQKEIFTQQRVAAFFQGALGYAYLGNWQGRRDNANLDRHHNERFRALMDALMPQWHLYKDELNRAPLAHETWRY